MKNSNIIKESLRNCGIPQKNYADDLKIKPQSLTDRFKKEATREQKGRYKLFLKKKVKQISKEERMIDINY